MFIKEMKLCCINGSQLWNNLLLHLNNVVGLHWINLLYSRGLLTCMTTLSDSRLLTHLYNLLLLYLILLQYLREIQHHNKKESLQQCSLLIVFWLVVQNRYEYVHMPSPWAHMFPQDAKCHYIMEWEKPSKGVNWNILQCSGANESHLVTSFIPFGCKKTEEEEEERIVLVYRAVPAAHC